MKALDIAFKHIRRSPYQAVAAILTMFLTFLLGGIFALTTGTSVLILRYFESKPQITVFFVDNSAREDAERLKSALEATGKTSSIKYISKEEALTIYKEQNKNDPLLLEMVTADILPSSLEVSASDPKYFSELEPVIKQAHGVEEIVYQKDVVDTLLSWTNAIRLAGGSLAALLAVDSLLILITVIGMKIALKREEIEILKLIGASRWYIRMPFVLEGGLYGMIGAFIAWIMIAAALMWARSSLMSFLGIVPQIHAVLSDPTSMQFITFLAGFWGLLVLTGFLLGSIGSLLALVRYLKF